MQKWTPNEELELIKEISHGTSFDQIAIKLNRSISATELRFKKIIYENITKGVSFETLSKKINLSEDKVRQYFYSYKDFKEKHTGANSEIAPTQTTNNIFATLKNEINSMQNLNGSSNRKINVENKIKQLEMENKLLSLIIENKNLNSQLNKLIKEGKVDKNVKTIIKGLREKH